MGDERISRVRSEDGTTNLRVPNELYSWKDRQAIMLSDIVHAYTLFALEGIGELRQGYFTLVPGEARAGAADLVPDELTL